MPSAPRRQPNTPQRLTPAQQRRLDRWERQWGRAMRQTGELRDAGETLIRAGDEPAAAGYPVATNSGPGQKGGHGDPTLAYVAHAGGGHSDENHPEDDTADTWPSHPDMVHDLLAELIALTGRVQRDLMRAARIKDMIVNRRDPRVHDVGGNCEACDRKVSGGPDDRLRSGYCDGNARNRPNGGSCYRAWLAYRERILSVTGEAASPNLFERERGKELDRQEAGAA